MLIKLFLAFTLIPVAEIYLLITLGGYIGAMHTVGLVVLTALTGAYLARLQGMITMFRIREAVQNGVMPSGDLIDAFLIFAAGIVLLTPGFITDIAGILLLVPVVRHYLRDLVIKKINHMISRRHIEFRQYP
ncbi:MAG TPA: FxsA family protein [Deltaproteobacteria bacterium]|nr:FxsA family protein [Deltaproteobacteria bacterium]